MQNFACSKNKPVSRGKRKVASSFALSNTSLLLLGGYLILCGTGRSLSLTGEELGFFWGGSPATEASYRCLESAVVGENTGEWNGQRGFHGQWGRTRLLGEGRPNPMMKRGGSSSTIENSL